MIRLFLVGFMGSGKTTLGRALSKDLSLTFIDMDQYIEGRFHRTVSQLFSERGEEGFRKLERNMLHEICEVEDVVVATGGGVPCFFDNMQYMNERGVTVWLNVPPSVIHTRLLISRSKRPLVAAMPEEELLGYIVSSLAEREPYYSRAACVFDGSLLENREQIVKSVARFKKEVIDVYFPKKEEEKE